MPHFKEGGAGSRELLTSGVDRGVSKGHGAGGRMWVEQQLVGGGNEEDICRENGNLVSREVSVQGRGLRGGV